MQSIDLLLAEVQDAAAALGQKLPAELDEKLQALYAKTTAAHVDGEDSAEAVVLVAALKTTVADYIESMFESKKEGMVVTLAPLTAITETYANPDLTNPDLTNPTPRPLTAITETCAAYGLPLALTLALLP